LEHLAIFPDYADADDYWGACLNAGLRLFARLGVRTPAPQRHGQKENCPQTLAPKAFHAFHHSDEG
jgi:hypothetical protein